MRIPNGVSGGPSTEAGLPPDRRTTIKYRRNADINRDDTDRLRLEKEVLEASETERRRIGQELHDSLGQHLLGIAFLSDVLKKKLTDSFPEAAAEAARIVELIDQALSHSRRLSRQLYAAELESTGLHEALRQMADHVDKTTSVRCRFASDGTFTVEDPQTATNLYRIAQEALNNIVRHSKATEAILAITHNNGELRLVIHDNGRGLPNPTDDLTGMGLRTMRYRAGVMGASINITNDAAGGMTVTCTLQIQKSPEKQ